MTAKSEGSGPPSQRARPLGRWILGLAVFGVGLGCQGALGRLYPYTGLAAVVTFPLTWLLSSVAAVGFVAASRRAGDGRLPVLFVSTCLVVCACVISLYPQDSGTSAWTLLWRTLSGA